MVDGCALGTYVCHWMFKKKINMVQGQQNGPVSVDLMISRKRCCYIYDKFLLQIFLATWISPNMDVVLKCIGYIASYVSLQVSWPRSIQYPCDVNLFLPILRGLDYLYQTNCVLEMLWKQPIPPAATISSYQTYFTKGQTLTKAPTIHIHRSIHHVWATGSHAIWFQPVDDLQIFVLEQRVKVVYI